MPTGKRRSVTKAEIAALNTARELYQGKELSPKEAIEVLKEAGIKANSTILKFMAEGVNPPLIKMKEGVYTFNENPIHMLRLQKVYDDTYEYCRAHMKKGASQDLTEENCVKFLKELGYRILKPITQYEEL